MSASNAEARPYRTAVGSKRTAGRWNGKGINVLQDKLSGVIVLLLTGFSPDITTDGICPGLTTKGLFRKGWIHINGTLHTFKPDKTNDCVNAKMEAMASGMPACFGNRLESVSYVGDVKRAQGEASVSIRKNFVGEGHSFAEVWEAME